MNNSIMKALACERNALGDEELYQQYLKRYGATLKNERYSATTLNPLQLGQLLNELRKRNNSPYLKEGDIYKNATDWRLPRIKKIRALWGSLAAAGVVENNTEKALSAWCERMIKVSKLQFATATDLNKAIEALKKWCDEKGVVYGRGTTDERG